MPNNSSSLPILNFPPIPGNLLSISPTLSIFDIIRKKWLILTPEEWVRQHIIHFLIMHLGYPANSFALEHALNYGKRKKRSDIVVYNQNKPFLMIECKAPHIKINKNVEAQIALYQNKISAKYLGMTNGKDHYFFENLEDGSKVFLSKIPPYPRDQP